MNFSRRANFYQFLSAITLLIVSFAFLGKYALSQTDYLLNFTGKVTNTDGSELADGNYDFTFSIYSAPIGGAALWTETLDSSSRFSATISGVTENVDSITYDYSGESATTTFQIGQYLSNASTTEAALIIDFDTALNTVTVASGSPLWSAGQAINNRPFVEGGVINENLGSVAALDAVDFSGTLYLEVVFNGEIMQPRKRLTTVNQAFDAINLGGKAESEYATLAEDELVSGEWTFDNIVSVSTTSALTALTITQSGSGNIVEFKRGATTSFAVLPDGRIQFENYTFPLLNGAPGYILKATAGGQLEWAVDFASGFGVDGQTLWATSSNEMMIYPIDTSYITLLGNNATSSPWDPILEVNGLAWFDNIGVGFGQELRFYDADSSNYVALRATSTLAGNYVLSLPSGLGGAGQALVSDGLGNLRWDSPTTFVYNQTGSAGQVAYYASGGSVLSGTSSVFILPNGNFGLGTTTPGFRFTLGTSTLNQFAIDEYGRVRDGAWQGDVIQVAFGGLGTTTFQANSVLYAPSANTVGEILAGTDGYVLKMSGGAPVWAPDSTLGGETSLWATSSNNLLIRPTTVTQVVLVGATATSSALSGLIFEVAGNSYFGGMISAQNLTLANALAVGSGGTGSSTPTGILLGDGAGNIVSLQNNSADWNTAFSWGNHADQNYFDRDLDVMTVAEGGLGTSTFTQYSLVYASGTNQIGEILPGTNGYALVMQGGRPVWASTSPGTAHDLLSSMHSDASPAVVARGDLITGQGAAARWTRLALAPAGYILRSDGTDIAWSTTTAITALGTVVQGTWQASIITESFGGTGQAAWSIGDLVFATGTNDLAALPIGAGGYILQAVNGRPSWVSTTSLGIDFNNIGGTLGADQGGTGADSSGWNGMIHAVGGVWSAVNGTAGQVAYWSDANTVAGENFLSAARGGLGQNFSTSTGFLYFDNGTASASSTISISRTNLAASDGIALSGNMLTLDRTGAWTGTFDGLEGSQVFTLSAWYSTTTDSLDEGSANRYYHTSLFAADLAATSTNALAEGNLNRYYHTYLFAADLAGTTTDALDEGVVNLYWTDARFDAAFGLKDTDDLSEGVSNLYYTTGRFASDLAGTTTDALAQGIVNLYWSDARFNAQFDGRLSATTSLPNIASLSALSAIGTITSGIWNGTAIGEEFGGLGQDFSAIPSQGIVFATSSGDLDWLPMGADGQALVVSGSRLGWQAITTETHNLLSATHGDASGTTTIQRGDIIARSAAGQWDRLELGESGYILMAGADDPYWATSTAITALGIITQGTWRGDIVEVAYGGTGAGTVAGARANLDLDEVYEFGINSTGTDGQIWQSDGDGRGRWVATSALGIVGASSNNPAKFIGTTTALSDGSIATGTLIGYEAANDICGAQFPGSFFCRTYDIFVSIEQDDISDWGNDQSSAWMAEGPPGYTSDSNDCRGWATSTSSFLGAYWKFNANGGGSGWLINCANNLPLACCIRN